MYRALVICHSFFLAFKTPVLLPNKGIYLYTSSCHIHRSPLWLSPVACEFSKISF